MNPILVELRYMSDRIDELEKENARLREALESIIDLSILGSDNQGKMALVARQALKRGKG
jgi:hypothetical protein